LFSEEAANMATAYQPMKPGKAGLEEPLEQIHKIRITLSSKNVKNLEKGLSFLSFYFDYLIISLQQFSFELLSKP
jgi:hypothetical protein